MILDFLDTENINCSYICPEREWYLRFLENNEFKKLYIKKLKDIASLNSVKEFYKLNIDSINFFNEQFLSETSKKDKVYYKGIGHIFLIRIIYLIDQNI